MYTANACIHHNLHALEVYVLSLLQFNLSDELTLFLYFRVHAGHLQKPQNVQLNPEGVSNVHITHSP